MSAPTLPARYRLEAPIGEGGSGRVFKVYDRERDARVALKLLTDDTEGARLMFRHEFWAMSTLPHPHLTPAFDTGETPEGAPFFTMKLVEGNDLAGTTPMPEAEVLGLLPDLASALAFLHGRGYFHGDLKPENLRVAEDGSLMLMDLGFLTRIGHASGPIRGSLPYLAPELIRQGPADQRADLYALGAVLYTLLTGHPPFEASDPLTLLRMHLEAPAPDPRARVSGLSEAMAGVVTRLLAKEPARRFQDAGAVVEALGLRAVQDRRQGLLTPPLVGRAAEWAALEALIRGEGPQALWLAGAAGAGKSRLLALARSEAQLQGVATLEAAGRGPGAAPYEALRPWLTALIADASPPLDRLAPILARLMPELSAEPAPPLEGQAEGARLRQAIVDLARARLPGRALWLMDNADRLDPASAELLEALRRAGEGASWRFLASGSEPAGAAFTPVALGPLDHASIEALAAGALGETPPPALVSALEAFSRGAPGSAIALMKFWLDEGAVLRRGGGWAIAPGARLQASPALHPTRDPRFLALGETTRRVLEAAAVLGPEGALSHLAHAAALGDSALFEAVETLEATGWIARHRERFRFSQAGVDEAIAQAIEAPRSHTLHDRAADWLEAHLAEPSPLWALLAIARHRLAGHEPAAAASRVLSAADRALALRSPAAVTPLLEAAIAALPAGAAAHIPLLERLTEGLRFAGELDQALAAYEETLLRFAHEAGRPDLLVTYGVLLIQKTRYQEALVALDQAIAEADRLGAPLEAARARTHAGRVAFFLGEAPRARQHLQVAIDLARRLEAGLPLLAWALALQGYLVASTIAGSEDEGLAMLLEAEAISLSIGDGIRALEALTNRGNVLVSLGRLDEAGETFLQHLALAERSGADNEVLMAELNLAGVRLEQGRLDDAAARADRALAMARKQGRRFPEGYLLALSGLVAIRRGASAPGLEALEAGLETALAIGNRYLELHVQRYRAEGLLQLGRLEAARAALEAARGLAEATGNHELDDKLAGIAARIVAPEAAPPSADGRAAPGDRLRLLTDVLDQLTSARDLPAVMRQGLAAIVSLAGADRGHLILYEGFREVARLYAGPDEGRDDPHSRSLAQEAVLTGQPLFIEDLTGHEGLSHQASILSLALRSAIALPLLDGHEVIGVITADSRRLAEGWSEADRALAPAIAAAISLAVIGARARDQDRRALDEARLLLGVARELFPARTPEQAAERVLAAALALTGAERAFCLPIGPEGLAGLDETGRALRLADSAISGTLLAWAREAEAPASLVELGDEALPTTQSVLALGLRSVFCAPVAKEGRRLGVLFLDGRRLVTLPPGGLETLGRLGELLAEAWIGLEASTG